MRDRLTDSGPTGVAVVRRIFDLTRVYFWHMLAACSFAGITAAISVLIPKFLGQGVDEAFTLFNQGNMNRTIEHETKYYAKLLVNLFH